MAQRTQHTASGTTFVATTVWLPILAIIALSIAGCTQDEPGTPQTVADSTTYDLTFPPPEMPEGRSLEAIQSADMDNDGRLEYVVASIQRDEFTPGVARADRIEMYRYDTIARSYTKILADDMEWADRYEFLDITGDGLSDFIVNTYGGGNDPVATMGMIVYTGDGGEIRKAFNAPGGNPQLITLDEGGNANGATTKVITLQKSFWPEFLPHVMALTYTDDMIGYVNGAFQSVRNNNRPYFRKLAETTLKEYAAARAAITGQNQEEMTMHMFNQAALSMLLLQRAGEIPSLRSFWSSERNYLKETIPDEYYGELEAIYAQTIAS